MRSLAFFVIPVSAIFLLVSLGLIADGVAQLSKIVKYYNSLGDSFTSSGGGGQSYTYRPSYSTQYSDGGGVFGSAFSSDSPYTYSSYDPDLFSTFDYDSALSSIYSKYSFTYSKREEYQTAKIAKRVSPTITPVIRQAVAQSTPAPLIKRLQEVKVQQTLQKRASVTSVSQAKSRFAAILAFYVLQLVTIVALLVTGIVFMIKFRKIDEEVQGKITSLQNNNIHAANTENLQQSSEIQNASSSIYQRTTIFRKFFLIFIILTVFYFIFGIVSFALLGSISIILGTVAATIAFWVFAFLACVAICITLLLDRRTSEEDEHSLRNPSSSFDGGEYGSKADGMIISSPQQQQNDNTQPVSMPQPQSPTSAGWQQSTAEHQQQYATQQQQSTYPTSTPTNESQPSSPPPPQQQQQQQQQSAGPIEGQIYRAVVDQHGNTQMVPVNP